MGKIRIREKHPGPQHWFVQYVQENARTIYATSATVSYLGNPYSEYASESGFSNLNK